MVAKAEISRVRALADKKGRAELGMFVVEGPKLVSEAVRSRLRVHRIFGVDGAFECVDEAFAAASREIVSQRELERMSGLKTPQGVLALVEIPTYDPPACSEGELMLALDGVQDPGNVGTILRLADWFGIRDVLCSPATADCYSPKVVQASMGAILRVRVHYVPLAKTISTLRCPVYGTFLEGENIYTADLGQRPAGVIVMGSEGSGIHPDTAALVTRKLFIPPFSAGGSCSESLNVATAAAIICSEFRRR